MLKNKKFASLALALTLVVSCMVPAFAVDTNDIDNNLIDESSRYTVVDGEGDSILKVDAAATQMTVTVPAVLPMSVSNTGVVTVATGAKIKNSSYGAVKVTEIAVAAKADGWSLVADDHDFNADAVGSKLFNFAIDSNYADADHDGALTVSASLGAQLDGIENGATATEREFTYTGSIPAQKVALNDVELATVTFTVDWAE